MYIADKNRTKWSPGTENCNQMDRDYQIFDVFGLYFIPDAIIDAEF